MKFQPAIVALFVLVGFSLGVGQVIAEADAQVSESVTPTIQPSLSVPVFPTITQAPVVGSAEAEPTDVVDPQPTDLSPTISPTVTPSISPTLTPTIAPDETDADQKVEKSKPTQVWNIIKELLRMRKLTMKDKDFQINEGIELELVDFQPEELEIVVTDYAEEPVTIQTSFEDGQLLVMPVGGVRPGKFHLEVYEGDREVFAQDFTWGVLALNANRSIYLPEEEAQLAFAVLDENGAMVCDAELVLKIFHPDQQKVDELSTANGLITVNPECKESAVTDVPDYQAAYQLGGAGTYGLELSAVTVNGSYSVSDYIEVWDEVPFEIERSSATRIYPPNTYAVMVEVVARQEFTGSIIEPVPLEFEISPFGGAGFRDYDRIEIDTDKGVQNIIWDEVLEVDETLLIGYQYQAPEVSPQFYLLGSLRLVKSTQVIEGALDLDIFTDETPTAAAESSPSNQIETDSNVILEPVLDSTESADVNGDSLADAEVASDSAATSSAGTITSQETIIFQELRQWQVAADAVYNVLAFWDGATAPTGWTCVSCASGDNYYQVFPRGAATSGGTGGLLEHSHGMTFVSHTNASSVLSMLSDALTHTLNTHTHSWTGSTTGAASNLPAYRNLKIVRYDTAGVPASIPNGLILIFDATPADAGWTRYSAQDNQFIRGENDATTTGGSDSHIHTVSGTLNATTNTGGAEKSGSSLATAAHTHTVSGNTPLASNLPDRVNVLLYENTSGADKYFTRGEIVMVEGTIGTSWSSLSDTGGDFYQRFLRGSSTYSTTTGATSHSHTNASIASGGPSASSPGRAKAPYRPSRIIADSTHTHAVTLSFDTQPHLPPYRDVVIAKKTTVGTPATKPTIEGNLYYDKAKITDTTPTIQFKSTDVESNDLTYQIQISSDPSFTTNEIDALSATHLGFANVTNGGDTDPFTAGNTISYTVQSGDALTNGTTYFYQVRAMDIGGTETWSDWSDRRSLTIDTSLNNGNAWFETHGEQFESDTLGGNASINYTSNYVEVTSSTGTVLSTPIVAAQIQPSETTWGYFMVGDDQTAGTIIYQVFYDNAGTPTIIKPVKLPA